MKSLSAIVVTHNIDVEMFRKMLVSLKSFTPELAQLIVFDNASPIEHQGMISDIFQDSGVEICYLRNDTNIGYIKGCNNSLPFVKYKFLAILNDDIEFLGYWSGQMIEILKSDPMVAQVSPKRGVCNVLNENGDGIRRETDSPDYAEGSCFMTRTSILRTHGFYDEAYEFGYHEDADLSLRLRKAGYKIRNVEMSWIHHGSMTASKMRDVIRKYQDKNRQTFKKRWLNGGEIK